MKKFFTGLLCGIFNGLLGAGGGVVAVLSLRKFLGVDAHKSHATAVAIILPLTIVSAVIYLGGINIDIATAAWVTAGGVIGGVIGAKLLKKISANLLHKIFGGIMIFAAIRVMLS
ncbi:MAG: TSUP family transporter [Defluviitaleaceae bacterium]|nr:TSUP family transporter [Defluviitaleaceae bacterium]